jgi:hypothetical protein
LLVAPPIITPTASAKALVSKRNFWNSFNMC